MNMEHFEAFQATMTSDVAPKHVASPLAEAPEPSTAQQPAKPASLQLQTATEAASLTDTEARRLLERREAKWRSRLGRRGEYGRRFTPEERDSKKVVNGRPVRVFNTSDRTLYMRDPTVILTGALVPEQDPNAPIRRLVPKIRGKAARREDKRLRRLARQQPADPIAAEAGAE